MAFEGGLLAAAGRIPQPDREVVPGTGQGPIIQRRERYRTHGRRIAFEVALSTTLAASPKLQLPQPDSAVVPGAGQEPAIPRRE